MRTILGMNCWGRGSLISRERLTACVTLIAFAAGNIGWPVTTGSVAGGKCCKVSGLATCCCGDKPGAKNCGCSQGAAVARNAPESREPVKKLPSCCQQRLEAAQETAVVANCACGESSAPGFVVLAQPKIMAAGVCVARFTVTACLAPTASDVVPHSNLTPETPPPRPS